MNRQWISWSNNHIEQPRFYGLHLLSRNLNAKEKFHEENVTDASRELPTASEINFFRTDFNFYAEAKKRRRDFSFAATFMDLIIVAFFQRSFCVLFISIFNSICYRNGNEQLKMKFKTKVVVKMGITL